MITTRQYSSTIGLAPRSLAKLMIKRLLQRLQFGHLCIIETDEQGHAVTEEFGDPTCLSATVTIHSDSVYQHFLRGGTIGIAEAYIEGLWSTHDLTTLVQIMVRNKAILKAANRRKNPLNRWLHDLTHRRNNNSLEGSKRNILSHYDVGNDFYETFLDSRMMYSSAVYTDTANTLESAAEHKLKVIADSLSLCADDHVIEIGTGWGGFAIYAAQHYGCRVTTTTISDAQHAEAQRRIHQAGLSDRITLLKQDYRTLEGEYDKLVSIEMIEAVGLDYLPLFFQTCNRLLKPGGSMLLQAITIRDQDYDHYQRSVDFIQRYIFPGGCLLSNELMSKLIAQHTDMNITALNDYGQDYARTLKDWRERFEHNESTIKDMGYDSEFLRLWAYYLSYCEGGFLEKAISVIQLRAEKYPYLTH